jgi:iron complex outermembrane recepter protein
LLHCTTLDVRGKQCQRAVVSRKLILLALVCASSPALAQRTTNNAVTASDDAFGRAVGNEKIGIYSTEDVRGFNPVEAGNVRIEGLYFDQQSLPASRLIDSSAIRVGYAARGYPFPAPTGIADLKLEKYEGEAVFAAEIESENYRNVGGSLQAKFPLIKGKLGLSAGLGTRRARVPYGRFGNFISTGVTLAWTPYKGAEVIALWGRFNGTDQPAQPILYPAGSFAPPHVARRVNVAQPWALSSSAGHTSGFIAKLPLGAFRLEAGVFSSIKLDPLGFADLELGVGADGRLANRVIIADADNHIGSTSGEVRLSRVWQSGAVRHTWVASFKARDQSRTYGGQQRIPLQSPLSVAGVPDPRPKPVFGFGPNDQSAVRQFTLGLGYDLQWKGHGGLSLAVQKTDYRKQTIFANPALSPTDVRDKPLLFSASGTINLAPGLSAYAGYVKGLEESPVAPDVATNRNEAPPAIRTNQKDAGIRYAITKKLSLIAGLFEVQKPYFNLDPTRRFRQLGVVSNQGVEVSLAGTLAPGLTVVAGTLLLDPKISGPDVIPGILGPRPVGSFKRHSIANFDWKPAGQAAWSFDLAFDGFSGAAGNSANSFEAPPRETLGLGARYRFKLAGGKWLLRGQVQNLFNNYGWKVSSSGGFTYTLPRTLAVSLAADF